MKNPSLSVAGRCAPPRTVWLLSALLGVFSAQAALAQEGPRTAGVDKIGELTYRVWACNPASRRGRVQLVDASNKVWYELVSTAPSLGRVLNVAELPDGRYEFIMKIGREEHRFGLNLRSTEVRLAEVGADQQRPAGPRLASVAAEQ